ncbi:MAG: hypothetical protein M0P95_10495 [Sulfuritalea sp.]|nr:hypothetical protein [Sulfuritalea sp.]
MARRNDFLVNPELHLQNLKEKCPVDLVVERAIEKAEMNSDEVLRLIASEIQTGKLDAVIWTRAFAEADGDHDRAKARYIRDRHAEIQAGPPHPSFVTELPGPAASASSPTVTRTRSELEVKREMLAKKLTLLGRRSLYSELDLRPTSDDTTVSQVIAQLREAEAKGRMLSAEEGYAIQTLRNPVGREQYDRKLLEELSRSDDEPEISEELQRGTILGLPRSMVAVIAALAVAVFATLGIYQEKSRKESIREALQVQQQAEAARLEREKQAVAEASERQAEAAARAAELTEQQAISRQRQIDDQARLRTTQIEIQQEQAEERKRQFALSKQQAEARAEQEKIRRTIYETERELCLTARRNNNSGEMMRWCR